MPDISPWSIAGAILTSLGGGALIVAALFRWLGDLAAKRILQREQNTVLTSLEGLKQELGLARLSYDKHVQHVVEYYALFYRHYQLCQMTEHADVIRHPEREDLDTKENFLKNVDSFASEWNSRQGLLRLILPNESLLLHEQIIDAFNDFKSKVKSFKRGKSESHQALRESFAVIDKLKQKLEKNLREHLRTDKI